MGNGNNHRFNYEKKSKVGNGYPIIIYEQKTGIIKSVSVIRN